MQSSSNSFADLDTTVWMADMPVLIRGKLRDERGGCPALFGAEGGI